MNKKAKLNANTSALKLIHADVEKGLNKIADQSVDLVLTSPPYNIGKSYERDQKMSLAEYLKWLKPIIKKICDKVTDGGSICWQVGNYIEDGAVYPLDVYFYGMFIEHGFKLRNRIIWRFNFGLHAQRRLSGRYETLLWFTKSDKYKFNLDPIRVPQLYPGKRHSKAKGKELAGKPSGNPLGKNPSDFWTFSAKDHFTNNPVWELPNVKANHPEQTFHPCQFPHELAERCVLAFTKPGDTILDPFIGAGTTAIASIKASRKVIGIDKSKEYIDLTKQRIRDLEHGKLRLRKSAQKVASPNARDRVAQLPIEWLDAAE